MVSEEPSKCLRATKAPPRGTGDAARAPPVPMPPAHAPIEARDEERGLVRQACSMEHFGVVRARHAPRTRAVALPLAR